MNWHPSSDQQPSPLHFLPSTFKRRDLLRGAGVLAGLALTSQFPQRVVAQPKFSSYPFTLGVASGDPIPDGVVLWTRLAPDPLNGGGVSNSRIAVRWQIAADENMRQIVKSGTEVAITELAHSVHVDVRGLKPNRPYWYQFKSGGEVSPIGRTRTAPLRNQTLNHMRFGLVNCQDWQNGYYTAYKHLAEEELDVVLHVGDYIYEYGPEPGGPRQHNSPEIRTLADYRNRHALYKTDVNLQAAHAAFPWIVTWDDHEVENNYADEISEDSDPVTEFVLRRAAAYQAYYEHMPLRKFSFPNGADMRLYRRLTYGNLAQFNVLDTRQYRTDQPCGDGLKPLCEEALDPNASLTGAAQERWLFEGLQRSSAQWNVLAQQVMFSQFDFDARPEVQAFNVDQWDGYVAARNRILSFLEQQQPSNPIVLAGDIHSSWVHDIKKDFSNPNSKTLGTEFVGTSISSDFPTAFLQPVTLALSNNPHTKFFNGALRGYVRCDLTRDRWQSDYRVVSTIAEPEATISTGASFVVEDGKPGAQRA
ncbi:MAG: alkaline phosphatase [Drouetiella hepatica Uher 2000/2452]|uniref:Alkaline phosphatase n=1 Tax=Drouetiella hepatica Uher 2000/2452 TaxID=904376 RepID=A0A951UKP5_9CYAN|nr:alkaline phosphatase [Drouetiella hepatica Uher 2000/2452]